MTSPDPTAMPLSMDDLDALENGWLYREYRVIRLLVAMARRVEPLAVAAQAVLDAARGWGSVTEREEDFVVESYEISASLIAALDIALTPTQGASND